MAGCSSACSTQARYPHCKVSDMRITRRTIHRHIAALLLVAATACASGTNARDTSGSRDLITRSVLQKTSYATAYDAVRALHPNWLLKRSTAGNTGSAILVYVDGTKYGDVNTLRSVPTVTVESIRRINATDATMRWGTGHSEGVLYITSVNRR